MIGNHIGAARSRRGLAAAELARLAGISRQTIYAIEAGTYVPNTAVALRLARALETTVEELFRLPDEAPPHPLQREEALLLPGGDIPCEGQPVQLCRVDRHVMAASPSPLPWYFPASDAVVSETHRAPARTGVQVFQPESLRANRLLVAGCDPGISVLARHLQAAGVELVLAHRNSAQALQLLHEGYVHVAGTHLRDEASGESNLPEVGRRFPRRSVAVVSFAVWEEGIVTARGNPKGIHGVEDLAREDVTIVNREAGAGSRRLLDNRLKGLGIRPANVRGYETAAPGHLPAAWRVRSGSADACVATRAAARLFGLAFVPLVTERYDLVIRRRHLELPAMQALLDALHRSAFRRELESLGGYDTAFAGRRLL